MFSYSHFLSNRKQSIMSKRAQESTSKEVSAVAKPRPMNFVSRNLLSAKKDPSHDSSDPNSLENQELDQSCVSWSARKLTRGVLCIFGSRTFVPTSWMCKKQTSVFHSSTESAIISLDAGLLMDGLPALDLWDIVFEVLRSTHNTPRHDKLAQGNLVQDRKSKTSTEMRKRVNVQLSNVDYVPTNTHYSQGESQLYIFDDNEAVIEMIIRGRSLTMRHVSRTHRVALDWLFDRIN